MLIEWFQKRQQPRPKIELESLGRRFRASVLVTGGARVEIPDDETFEKKEQAEQAAATAALLQLFPEQPLYRLLPPAYKTLWLQWAEVKRAPQQQEAAAALLARDRYIQELAGRPLQPFERKPKRKTAVGGASERSEEEEAAFARLRQEMREAEDEAQALEEEQRERREAAQRHRGQLEGVRLQVAWERWQQGDEGQAARLYRESLPVSTLEEPLRRAMETHQVAIVCGETGSGKSTQVPQMLLEAALGNGLGGATSIICTQPRRIAATSLARRVANERCQQVGGRGALVGYQVRLEAKRTESTRLLFCTTGIALRMLLCEPPLEGISHVVVDEVHERDTQTDLLLLLLRELLPLRPKLRVLLMSATVQSETFSRYFDGAPVLTAQGRSYPVTEHPLEDVLAYTGHVLSPDSPCRVQSAQSWHKASFATHRGTVRQELQDESGGNGNPDYDEARYDSCPEHVRVALRHMNEHVINVELVMELLGYIDAELGDGAVLVFLPGLANITELLSALVGSRAFGDASKWRVLPLHSSLSPAEQQQVFETMPPGVRKVVLATNIAETSITIDDAVFVIDSGRAKQSMFDERKQMRRLVDVWISQAEARQRAGRAGRVRAGHNFKLYTHHRHTVLMQPARTPEMLRGPLQEVCLQLRLAPLLGEMPLRGAMARMIDTPPEVAVTAAVSSLQRTGALDADEALTPLGRHLAALPTEISVGRLLVYGAMLRCAQPVLLIAAALSDRSPFLQPFGRREEARLVQANFNKEQSDHLAVLE